MKKISYICDMCGKDATINYYTINIKQNLDQLGRVTVDGAARNCENFFRILKDNELIYCEKCVKAIEEHIRITRELIKEHGSELPYVCELAKYGFIRKKSIKKRKMKKYKLILSKIIWHLIFNKRYYADYLNDKEFNKNHSKTIRFRINGIDTIIDIKISE